MRPVFSCYQAAPLLEARERGATHARTSFDLGKTEVDVALDEVGVRGATVALDWSSIELAAASDSVCFALEDSGLEALRVFSEEANRSFQLWPTQTSPALLISGFLMHRVRDVAPHEGAERMVRALGKIRGAVLDTTSGLGYAACAAARTATHVTTIEIQPVVRQIARQNPWSQELFDNPKIHLLEGDASELVRSIDPGSFSGVVHDPPAINLAGELYSADFYAAVLRVLTRGGKMFHYIGDANSASGGRTTRGVVKRLREAGFSRVDVLKDAFGVLASV
jgi:predicted methyltransferase